MIAKLKAFWARLEGWKTYVVSALIAAAAMVVQVADAVGTIDLSSLLPPKIAPLGPFLTALIMMWLRSITKTPPAGKKE